MKFVPTDIPDVVLIETTLHGDERGFFMETWRENLFAEAGIDTRFVQDNHSRSVGHTLRGLHYQIIQPQGKLVRVSEGEVFDVAVDLREHSPTCGRWVGEILSAQNRRQMWVPGGFAHGFLVLSDVAEFIYKCSDYYAPHYERTLKWDDPEIGIDWPLAPGVTPIMSEKDMAGCSLAEAELF
ncbi:MAG: dTDP-4-dehydrorhamnose 3,5-epimerase [Gammaproteobacteria bacterium]|nr:dTDP-4-dehydrorhamnose 3,5-epimerase [Gammaproteobacteria bacterium]